MCELFTYMIDLILMIILGQRYRHHYSGHARHSFQNCLNCLSATG